ncbi:hypothetical protein VQY73_004773, partial [Salmonella enterica]|nr:hypothetical protein [Salmonella enterica]EMD4063123.1 hypothetical protein [Salmonella enterica]EMD4122094.1 hypothetical protein [Salmonella enterica]EMD4298329.1 hypothetical protein [Salmonella enterica]EMD4434849.1 hypothetical protein [Salmonella enterica]
DGDITLQAAKGSVWLQGSKVDGKPTVSVTADKGNITISSSTTRDHGMSVNNVSLSAGNNVSIKGEYLGSGNKYGVLLYNVNIAANRSIGIEAKGKKFATAFGDTGGALTVYGKSNFTAPDIKLYGENTASSGEAGVAFGVINTGVADLTFNGNTSVNGTGIGRSGVTFGSATNITVNNSTLNITGTITGDRNRDASLGSGGITRLNGYYATTVNFIQNNADINIVADTTGSTGNNINAFDSRGASDTVELKNGFIFIGTGNTTITGKANKGSGVNTREFSNTGLNGTFTINGSSISGNGVDMDTNLNAKVINATITGTSTSGNGVSINSYGSSVVDLKANNITGISESAAGIVINGKNITITNGTLNGSATSGNGSGVVLTGNT